MAGVAGAVARNPRLNDDHLAAANALLAEVHARISDAAGGDDDHFFALLRTIARELTYDKHGQPGHRKRLKKRLYRLQDGRCAHCLLEKEVKGSDFDRRDPRAAYTTENVNLTHQACAWNASRRAATPTASSEWSRDGRPVRAINLRFGFPA